MRLTGTNAVDGTNQRSAFMANLSCPTISTTVGLDTTWVVIVIYYEDNLGQKMLNIRGNSLSHYLRL